MHKIKDIIKKLPKEPGVYQYFDSNEKLLYIGKAKNLNNRVKSYWKLTPSISPKHNQNTRIGRMLTQCEFLDYIVVDSEEDALILENSLIKQLKPKYNILLRDDKTYPYIVVDLNENFPRFEITRKTQRRSGLKYYGPFPSGSRELFNALYEFYPLVQKRSCLNGKKACLFYEIGKCPAPCEGKIEKSHYLITVKEAQEAIKNRKHLIELMSQRMITLAENERFEEAAKLRDSIDAIKALQINSNIDFASSANYDIFTIEYNQNVGVVVKIFMRDGKIVSSTHSFFRNIDIFDENEAYKQAIFSHYKKMQSIDTRIILTAVDYEDKNATSEAISKMLNCKVTIETPKVGKKLKLIEITRRNAQELLKQKASKEETIELEVKELFNLQRVPYRVETFDNSHMMGQATVGAMVVFDDGKWDKDSFRRYELKAKDEYSQMREMLERRVDSFIKNSPPDLWVIDGGSTLLSLALGILRKSKVDIDVIAIAKEKLDSKAHRAKGAAKDIIYNQYGEVYEMKTTDKRLIFIQKLRDKAHNFAITYHKSKKRKEDLNLSLYETKGIGKATVKKLIDFFGTFSAIENATFNEIAKVTNKNVAKSIKNVKNK